MPDKKKFLLRMDDKIYAAIEKWAADDFRSINAQIEFLLKEALKKASRPVNVSTDNNVDNENPVD
jgi:hypothetical protein